MVNQLFKMERRLFVLHFFLIWFLNISKSNSELLSVVQIFRHGERTPLMFYPKDPYQDPKYWNGLGPGELTENGKRQLFELGRHFGEIYDSFIGDEYNNKELLVKSCDTDRNFQSAESFLKALFFKPDLDIPIETVDWPIMSSLVGCPKFDMEYVKLEGGNKQLKNISKTNQELYDYVDKYSGFPIFGLASAMMVSDTLAIENTINLPLPNWTTPVFPHPLMDVSKNFSMFVCYNEIQQKLGVGPFLNELIEHFEKIIVDAEEPKTVLYSGHDVNLACLLSTFGFYKNLNNLHMPPFASTLTFELWRDYQNIYFVNVYYRPQDQAILLKLKNCEYNCEFKQFRNIFRNLRLTNSEWYMRCLYLL